MNDLLLAKQILTAGNSVFVLVKEGTVVASGTESGAVELLSVLLRLGPKAYGASLADKVVGKAVALMAAYAGIVAVDARLASAPALAFLRARGIAAESDVMVPQILNRSGDGPCPLEKLSLPITEPAAGVQALRQFFADQITPMRPAPPSPLQSFRPPKR